MDEPRVPTGAEPRLDRLTVAAVAAAVYALAAAGHEGLGHGGACVAVGGVPRVLSSMDFHCDLHAVPPAAAHTAGVLVAAAGTLVQLMVGLSAWAWYERLGRRAVRPAAPVWWYALWLCAAVNVLQGVGYFLYSGVSGIGDWADVTAGWRPIVLWRAALAVGGGALYWRTTVRLFRALGPFVGATGAARYPRATALAVVPYVVGGGLSLAAGLRNPAGLVLVAISGAAASLGGTSGLAWGPQTLRGAPSLARAAVAPCPVGRSWPAIVVGALTAAVFVTVLGPGVHLR